MKFTFAPESRPLEGYTIKRAIHRGGFGEVYYALSDAGKEVALKLLNNNLEVELRGVSQCLNLTHPNLVTIFDIREDKDKDHWIVMEYVGGRGLFDVVRDHPDGMPLELVLHWLTGITSGLCFLHDRGIVHRDLKPANVFSDDGVVKIGDVGLSKYISESRRSAQTQSVGTVYYMAPEVARGRYGREVDVYAVGIMLYEMLTGHVPFDGQTTAEILMKHLTAEPDLQLLPEPLRPVLAASLEKDPEKRIAEIEELETRFRQAATDAGLVSGQPVVSRPRPRTSAGNPRQSTPGQASAAAAIPAWVPIPAHGLYRFWTEKLPRPVRWLIIGFVAIQLLKGGGPPELISAAVTGFICYLIYNKFVAKSSASEGIPVKDAAGSGVPSQRVMSPSPRPVAYGGTPPYPQPAPRMQAAPVYSPSTRRQIPGGQRLNDLLASMSLAVLATALVSTAVYLSVGFPGTAHFVFFSAITLLGSWSILILAKIWEGHAGDNSTRKLIQGIVGIGVGAVAESLHKVLMLSSDTSLHARGTGVGHGATLGKLSLTTPQGFPTMAGFMVFFGLLFTLRRWWWQADSFRASRFRISSSLITLVLGLILAAVMPFPETFGALWAVTISSVVQLSAGWTPPQDRILVAPASLADTVMPATATSSRGAVV